MPAHILIVDDDAHIRDVIRFAIEDAGMKVSEAENGAQALTGLGAGRPDLIVLDVGMPEMDGFETCKVIRKSSDMPILFLTARDDEIDRVLGFELGGDDYVSKPFSPRELVLRIRAILGRGKDGKPEPKKLSHGALEIDPDSHSARLGEQSLKLTGIELGLLAALAKAPERVLSRQQLIEAVYGNNTHLSGRTVDSHIRNIRGKAAELGFNDLIRTVHGVGIRLGSCES